MIVILPYSPAVAGKHEWCDILSLLAYGWHMHTDKVLPCSAFPKLVNMRSQDIFLGLFEASECALPCTLTRWLANACAIHREDTI